MCKGNVPQTQLKVFPSYYHRNGEDCIHANATLEFDSTIRAPWWSHSLSEDNSRAVSIARNFASSASLIPTDTANLAMIRPISSQRTPPIPAGLGFPLADSCTLNFHIVGGGGSQSDLFLCLGAFIHEDTPSRFKIRSLELYGHSDSHPFIQKHLRITLAGATHGPNPPLHCQSLICS